MEKQQCYKLIQHFSKEEWENTVAVSFDPAELFKVYNLVNKKNWKLETQENVERQGHRMSKNYFAIMPVQFV